MRRRLAGSATALAVIAAVAAAAPAAQARQLTTGTCKGNDKRCVATLAFNGGSSGRRIVVNLLGTNMELRAVHAIPSEDQSAFAINHGHFKLGGSQFVALLDAVNGIGKFQLRFVFKAP